ncbi:MAG TPA: peptidoglycan DD-metalloendopeptidase family protein [Gallionella sp.]|nr:peptidoglycan DD-metalloendopeptidase family protein [Gallionella sp.]
MTEGKKKLRWFVALSALPLLGVVTAFGLVPQSDFDLASNKVDIENVALPKVAADKTVADYWRNERVQRGDTVDELLRRLSIEDTAAGDYLRKSADTASFRKLPVGTEVQAETNAAGELIALRYLDTDSAQILINKQQGEFHTKTLPAQMETRLFVRTGEIKTNLYAATDAAGLSDSAANQLSDLFSGDIDFHHDLRKGDRFTVVYEMTYSNGALLHMGRIQAAEFINQGHAYRALYFEKDAQHGDYYTPDGKSVHKAFLRSPIPYSRVSSSFSLSRFHPILKKWRSHKGTDFAAPMGTKVKVTADGIVAVVGREGGYGNVIMVNHQGRYTTVYGHLSRFAKGLHKGQHVAQGEVIGYVGMTGLATGPHLHYEFRVNGQQKDALRVALPDAKPIDSADLAAFQPVANGLVARLNLLRNTNLAQLD